MCWLSTDKMPTCTPNPALPLLFFCSPQEAPKLTVSKKQGKNTFEVVYEAKPKLATLTWKNGPVKVSVGQGMR